MISRLIFLSLACEGLYLVLRTGGHTYGGGAFWAIWGGLFLAYGLAIRTISEEKGGRAARVGLGVGLVFVTSAAFRATLFPSGDGWEAERAALLTADLLAMALELGLLRKARLPSGLVLVHGWNPFVITELGSGPGPGLQLLAIAGLIATLRLAQAKRFSLAALSFGASLAGMVPIAATLVLVGRALRAWLLAALALAGAIWFLRGPPAIPEELIGGSLFPCLATLSSLVATRDPSFALAAAATLFAAVAVLAMRQLKDDLSNLPEKALVSAGAFIFLAPFVDPSWFVLIGSLAAYSRNRGWLVLTATAPLTHLTLGEGSWSFWLGFAQYFPAYASLTYSWLGRAKK